MKNISSRKIWRRQIGVKIVNYIPKFRKLVAAIMSRNKDPQDDWTRAKVI